MLILHKNYQFTAKDIGKKALLANFQTVKILTVIREAGRLHSVIGVMPGFTDVIEWNSAGKSVVEDLDIVMLFNEDESDDQSSRQRF